MRTLSVSTVGAQPKQRVCVHIHVVVGLVSQIMIVLETDTVVNQLMSESYGQADRKTLPELLWRCVRLTVCEASEAYWYNSPAHPPPHLKSGGCASQQFSELLWQLQPSPLLRGTLQSFHHVRGSHLASGLWGGHGKKAHVWETHRPGASCYPQSNHPTHSLVQE